MNLAVIESEMLATYVNALLTSWIPGESIKCMLSGWGGWGRHLLSESATNFAKVKSRPHQSLDRAGNSRKQRQQHRQQQQVRTRSEAAKRQRQTKQRNS